MERTTPNGKALEFSSLQDFANFSNGIDTRFKTGYGRDAWAGDNFHSAFSKCISGDDALVVKAEELLEKFDTESLSTELSRWDASPYGAYPMVAEYLQGRFDCMRTRVIEQTEVAPITIWVDLVSSAGVSAASLTKRGIAILALLLKLQAVRPFTLKLTMLAGGRDDAMGNLIINIESKPLELATVCHALTNPAVFRLLGHNVWGHGDMPIMHVSKMQEHCGAEIKDLCIPAAHLDERDEIVSDPVAWINKQLKLYGVVKEEGWGD